MIILLKLYLLTSEKQDDITGFIRFFSVTFLAELDTVIQKIYKLVFIHDCNHKQWTKMPAKGSGYIEPPKGSMKCEYQVTFTMFTVECSYEFSFTMQSWLYL